MKKKLFLPIRILIWVLCVLIGLVAAVFVGEKFVFSSFFFGGARAEMPIPGLWSNFVPQGFDRLEDGRFVLSGYDKTGTGPSLLYIIDGEEQSSCELYNPDGSPYTSHAGGVAHFGNYIYVTNDTGEDNNYCDMFLLSDVTDGDDKATLYDSITIPNRLAYCAVYEGKLYAGAFFREGNYPTPETHRLTTPCGDKNTALMMVYSLDQETGKPVNALPERVYSTTSLVQGMCVSDSGKIILSASWGLSTSHLYVYDEQKASTGVFELNGEEVPLTYLDGDALTHTINCPPMAEGLEYANGRVFILTESACMKYIFGKITSGNQVYSFPIE